MAQDTLDFKKAQSMHNLRIEMGNNKNVRVAISKPRLPLKLQTKHY